MSLGRSSGTACVSPSRSVRVYAAEEIAPTLRAVAAAILANGIHWIDPDLFTQAASEIEHLRAIAGPITTDPDFATIRQDMRTR